MKSLIIYIVLALGGQQSWSQTQAKNVDKPNILLIVVDDLGYADLSSYGSNDMETPHIDNLVTSGMKFSNFHANSSVCSPTRASILTGCYSDIAGVPGVIRTDPLKNWGYLSKSAILLPKILKSINYHSAIIGKWHLGLESPNIPNDRGFDIFHGFLGDMMDDYYTHLRHNKNYMRFNKEEISPKGHATDIFSNWACDYIYERAKTEVPFFLYLAFNAPHFPIQPPPKWLAKVNKKHPEISDKRARLVALIEHLDAAVGDVINALKESGVYDNTLIIFTSDNGGSLKLGANNGNLRDGKGSMYEGGLRIPACVVWPNHIKSGIQNSNLFLTMDIFPTILEAVGIQPSESIDGSSFLSVAKGQSNTIKDRTVFFCRKEGGLQFAGKNSNALISGKWKLIQNTPFSELELFDLNKDTLEENNVIEKEKDQFKNLIKKLQFHNQEAGKIPWQSESISFEHD
jgi:arylsulfatase A-like enzyme